MDVLIMDMGPDVKGESTLEGYKGKFELLSFSHGMEVQPSGDITSGERISGKPNPMSMTVSKYLDSASHALNQACIEWKLFPEVNIIIGQNDGGRVSEVIRYTLKGVHISSIYMSGDGGDKPVETLMLDYDKITWNFTPRKTYDDD